MWGMITDHLLEQGKLTHDQVTHATQTAEDRGVSVGDALIQMHLIDQSDVLQAQAALADIPWVDSIDIDQIDVELSDALPVSFARNHGVLPLWEDNDTIKIAISRPSHFDGFDALRIFFDKPIEPLATNDTILIDAINKVFDRRAAADQVMSDIADEQVISGEEGFDQIDIDIIDADDEAPIIRLVNAILNQAVKARASDIHIEPFDRHIAVRFRIDGVLSEILEPPKKFHASISSRIKVMAGLDIAEKRIPQDGRIKIKVAGKDIDIRLSTVPTNYGERLVMRLLDKSNVLQDLSNIGMGENVLNGVNELLGKSYGIVLVTGPTGSGKTSTLYACLAKINSPVRNIITVENPVEYQLNGIGQIQTNEKVGLTFASGLRSILRQDPDVVMVGEIRDSETANIAIQASLTGHLVFSTVHTNDAASAVSRLVDMGVEPFLVSSSLVGMMAQRLVRRLCESCKQPVVPTETELDQLGLDRTRFNQLSEGHCYRPVGCAECMDKGYIGRIAIFELLVVDDDIRKLIMENVASSTIKKKAIQRGMVTLREDGRSKILAGITSIDEVLRVTQDDLLELEE
jgi:general secretion pathway protein E